MTSGDTAPTAGELFHLGLSLQQADRLDDAVQAYSAALHTDPASQDARVNLGACLLRMGLSGPAANAFSATAKANPNHPGHLGNLLYALHFLPEVAPATLRAWHERWARPLEAAVVPLPPIPRDTGRTRLRIGFVSGDLRDHTVGRMLDGVLPGLRRNGFELYAYSSSARPDAVQQRLRGCFDAWLDIAAMPNAEAARRIRDDRIDILVDLAGHTEGGRLPVFAHRPAPLQLSWLGYWATTGLTRVDAVLGDRVSSPPGNEAQFVERIVRLPMPRLPFTPPDDTPPPTPPPAEASGFVTFGSFNNVCKMNEGVVALWASILDRVPGSRLYLKQRQLQYRLTRDSISAAFAGHGIDPSRLVLEGHSPRDDYYRAHARVDIALDPFPFNGGLTSLDALWMGVPLLTLAGDRMVARQGAMVLSALGLDDWIAGSEQDYLERAVAAARDLPGLHALRGTLRARLLAADFTDMDRYADALAAQLRALWQNPPGIPQLPALAGGPSPEPSSP